MQVDRTTVALYYSSNGIDWLHAGIVDYHLSFGRHFTYPHMIVDNSDLLIVMRATFAPEGDDVPPPPSPNSAYYKYAHPSSPSSIISQYQPQTQMQGSDHMLRDTLLTFLGLNTGFR